MRIDTDWYAKRTGKTEVGKLNGSLAVDEKILGLQISVNHAPLVTEEHCLQNLVQVTLQQWQQFYINTKTDLQLHAPSNNIL